MIATGLFRRPRMLLLAVGLILVTGISSYTVLPRMEDPILGKRVSLISTVLPGGDAERVESLVTEKLEAALSDIAEIKRLESTSRSGVSTIAVELRDEIVDVQPVWSRVNDRLDEASRELPAAASAPRFEQLPLKACAAIVAVKWDRKDPVNFAILRRLAQELTLAMRSVPGTDDVESFGDPSEQVLVELNDDILLSLGLSPGQVAQQLQESDAKHPAGHLRSVGIDLALDVDVSTDSLTSLGETPIRYGGDGKFVSLLDIASITKGIAEPPNQLALVDSNVAVVLGALIDDTARIDYWIENIRNVIDEFESQLPSGIQCELIFSQAEYVQKRLHDLFRNLLLGTGAVVFVVFLLMGWRSTLIMATALPLSALMVLVGLRFLKIPIHQMSVTGLIIALGLLIDNVIVMVDEVRSRIWDGMPTAQAVTDGVRHLSLPLFGSTLTTTLAFAPIALLPGPPGEFVGSIAISVILAINSSFILAVTVVPAMTALLNAHAADTDTRRTVWRYGYSNHYLRRGYEATLTAVLRRPWLGVVAGASLPLIGFVAARQLPEQFFPPSDRTQIQIEIELAAASTLQQTRHVAESMRQAILEDRETQRAHWFLGASAPTFYYNVVPRRRNASFYGQAIVELRKDADPPRVAQRLQRKLASEYPECRVLVRQLEQGPPFDAPVELRLEGPDLATLQDLGNQLRLLLSQSPSVIATRSDLDETLPKLAVDVDQPEARLARLSQGDVARQLYGALDGLPGGSLLDGSQELPIRVRMARRSAPNVSELSALGMSSPRPLGPTVGPPARVPPSVPDAAGPPLSAIAELRLDSEVAVIPRLNGQRINEVKAYVVAGTLPSTVLDDLQQRMRNAKFTLPAGYRLQFGGEAAKRDEAVRNLMASASVLFFLIVVTLVLVFQSFRVTLIVASVGGLSIGLGVGALAFFGFPFGFMAIIGTMGLIGVAINDAIVVMAGIRGDPAARQGDLQAIRRVVVGCTRHVVATTITTMAGFTPLVMYGGAFWPPLAITIAGGVSGATLLALFLVPSLYILLMCPRRGSSPSEPDADSLGDLHQLVEQPPRSHRNPSE
jgi:multidrug efflux pump subunit AcrB